VKITLTLLLLAAATACAADLWLAVGYGGRRMISTDGRTWNITAEWAQPGADDSNNLMSAVWAKNQFVVVGGGGSGLTAAGHILVSKDGSAWKEVYTGKTRVNPVVFGADRFVAGTSTYPSGRLMWSLDGEKWNPGAQIPAKGYTHFRGGAYGNGIFVLTGNAGGNGGLSWAIVSPDGEKITSERSDLPGQGRLIFAGGHFIMMAGTGPASLIRSKDGITWETAPLPEGARVSWLVNAGTGALAGNNKTVFSSPDGVTWKASAMSPKGNILWSDGQRFIGSSWPGRMTFSEDGITWENANGLTDNGINRVVKAEPPPK
jgi:hypothetical protein